MKPLRTFWVLAATVLAVNLGGLYIVVWAMRQIGPGHFAFWDAVISYFVISLLFFEVFPFGAVVNFAIMLVMLGLTAYFFFKILKAGAESRYVLGLAISNAGFYLLPLFISVLGEYSGP